MQLWELLVQLLTFWFRDNHHNHIRHWGNSPITHRWQQSPAHQFSEIVSQNMLDLFKNSNPNKSAEKWAKKTYLLLSYLVSVKALSAPTSSTPGLWDRSGRNLTGDLCALDLKLSLVPAVTVLLATKTVRYHSGISWWLKIHSVSFTWVQESCRTSGVKFMMLHTNKMHSRETSYRNFRVVISRWCSFPE